MLTGKFFILEIKPGFRGKNIPECLIQCLQHLACLDPPRHICFLQAEKDLNDNFSQEQGIQTALDPPPAPEPLDTSLL